MRINLLNTSNVSARLKVGRDYITVHRKKIAAAAVVTAGFAEYVQFLVETQ